MNSDTEIQAHTAGDAPSQKSEGGAAAPVCLRIFICLIPLFGEDMTQRRVNVYMKTQWINCVTVCMPWNITWRH